MPLVVNRNLLLYADDSGLKFQHRDVEEIEMVLNNDFKNICDWFVDNKLTIHYSEDKTKSVLFASKCKIKNKKYQDIEINQHSQLPYLGYIMSGEPMTLKVIHKVNGNRSFFTRKIIFYHLGFKECYAMPSNNHILIMHALRTLTIM